MGIEKTDIHIDVSRKYFKRDKSAVALVTSDRAFHRGCVLTGVMKQRLVKYLGPGEDYAKLHAAVIWHLIEDLDWVDNIVICHDENPSRVISYLDVLAGGIQRHIAGQVIPLTKFKQPNSKTTSLADNYAKSYWKRGLKPWAWHNGPSLNVKQVELGKIVGYLEKL